MRINDLQRRFHGPNGEPNDFAVSDIEEDVPTEYHGFVSLDGRWIIMQSTTTAVRYAKGKTDYTTNWTGRAALTYGYYYEL